MRSAAALLQSDGREGEQSSAAVLGRTRSSGCFSCRALTSRTPQPLQQGAGPQGLGAWCFQHVDAGGGTSPVPNLPVGYTDGGTNVKEGKKKCIFLLVVVGRSWSKISDLKT